MFMRSASWAINKGRSAVECLEEVESFFIKTK